MTRLSIVTAGILVVAAQAANAQAATGFPANVKPIELKPNATVEVAGKIDDGKAIDLEFAQKSSNACFVAPAFDHYRGNHVFYSAELPKYSEMYITVTADEGAGAINVYAYSVGKTRFDVPPALPSCVSCEASPATSAAVTGPRKIRLNAINNPYNVVIGVAGASGVVKGGFKLSIELKTKK